MPQLTGGQAVVAGLRRAGIDTLFGIPGVHNGGLYDALLDAPDLRLVITRHEQGAAFMADGYARASGRTACVVTITGPGITNASTGLAEAYGESSPVLHIATALGMRSEPAETGELHELRDQSGLLRALVAHHQLVESVSDIPHAIHRGLRAMADDRPGPVSIEIPLDLLTATGDVALPERLHTPPRTPAPEAVDRAAALLADADAPLLFLGSGAMDAGPEAAALAERLHAPVLTAQTGKGAIPESHPLALGCKNRRDESLYEFLRTRDVILVVGCRLGARMTEDGRMPLAHTVIQIDRDADALARWHPVSVALHADAATALSELLEALPDQPARDDDGPYAQVDELRRLPQDALDDPRSAAILGALREVLPYDAVLVNDMTLTSYHAATLFPGDVPRSYMFPIYFGTLGFSLPAAIARANRLPRSARSLAERRWRLPVHVRGVEHRHARVRAGGGGGVQRRVLRRHRRALSQHLRRPQRGRAAAESGLRGPGSGLWGTRRGRGPPRRAGAGSQLRPWAIRSHVDRISPRAGFAVTTGGAFGPSRNLVGRGFPPSREWQRATPASPRARDAAAAHGRV